MKILGIESSCDETAAAIVVHGTDLVHQALATSLDLHRSTGGIVPEVAARAQIESIIPVLRTVLGGVDSSKDVGEIDAIAVTVIGLGGSSACATEARIGITAKSSMQPPARPSRHPAGCVNGQ